MKLSCQRCHPNMFFEIPHFSIEEKINLQQNNAISPLLTVKMLLDVHQTSHKDAKFIVQHMNKQYNHCNRCNSSLDTTEYTTCGKCGALNFNWNVHS